MNRVTPLPVIALVIAPLWLCQCQNRKKAATPTPEVRTLRGTWDDSSKGKKFEKWQEREDDKAQEWFDKVMD